MTVSYRDGPRRRILVLDEVNLSLHTGLTAVVGPSGSGKSTLLRVLGGVQRPDSGKIHHSPDDVAMTFQDARLVPFLSVQENVALAVELAGRSPHAFLSSPLLDRLGVAHLKERLPGTLSGGEQQRVAVARAAATDPQLLLVDEPTASLDEESAEVVISTLRAVADDGARVLVATHDQAVTRAADRVLRLARHQLVEGEPW
ncbi:ABC transporter ATP-binding protein [Knoellia remsis]|uniref:ABC transporter ATP-binding protein n=1 Tax=Knoellia remsis TaxID=407159 RepID=UPI0014762511|nr:ATP-binding cassette domain-containing protein [Knoellia remsis]